WPTAATSGPSWSGSSGATSLALSPTSTASAGRSTSGPPAPDALTRPGCRWRGRPEGPGSPPLPDPVRQRPGPGQCATIPVRHPTGHATGAAMSSAASARLISWVQPIGACQHSLARGGGMPDPEPLLAGLVFPESPRWHGGRLWLADWGTQEIV